MELQRITTDDVCRMENQEGLILQGCGGSLRQWVDGINEILTEEGCLLGGTIFRKVNSFEHDGCTCLLFPFTDDVRVNVERLAAWRIQSHAIFGGTWLSDFVPNRLGGFARDQPETKQERTKPDCSLSEADGNMREMMRIASQTLREHDMADEAAQMCNRISQCQSYDSALSIIGDYVNIAPAQQEQKMKMEML